MQTDKTKRQGLFPECYLTCYFVFFHHPVQHDVRIADNVCKSLEVMKVVTCFLYDEFSTFGYWEVKMFDIWSILHCSHILERG